MTSTTPTNTPSAGFVCQQAVNNPSLSNSRPTEIDMEYTSTIMLPFRGQFVQAVTTYDKTDQRWITSFWWMWLSVKGFTHRWIRGDAVKSGDVAWLHKTPKTEFSNGTLVAHDDAVRYFIKCANAHKVPAATYMGKDIPNLFGPSRFEADVKLDDSKQQPHNPIDDILNAIQTSNIKTLYATQEDIEAINKMASNQSHNLTKKWYGQSDNYALGA
jgi:hypothetical protein